MKLKTKMIGAGAAVVVVGGLAGASAIKEAGKLGDQLDIEIMAIANGEELDETRFTTGTTYSIAEAIVMTLDKMGDGFADLRSAAGAACLVGELNGGDMAEGIVLYREGVFNNDPAKYEAAFRSCEAKTAAIPDLTRFKYPDAIAD